MRFVLDQNVDARLGRVLRGHECWPVGKANLALAGDDELTAYACDKGAVMVTHDVEFSQRRARNVIGKHLQLRCEEPDAVDLVTLHFDAIIANLETGEHVFVQVSAEGLHPLDEVGLANCHSRRPSVELRCRRSGRGEMSTIPHT